MKKLLFLLLSFASMAGYSQSETHNFVTYDTVYYGPSGRWNLRISRPANGDTAARPAIITMPGQGEFGTTDTTKLVVYGPHWWLNNGWDGSVVLGNGTHYPILITTTFTNNPWPSPDGGADVLGFLLKTYSIKRNSVHLGGLSQGSMLITGIISYEKSPGDETGMKMITSITALEGFSWQQVTAFNSWNRFPTSFKIWAAKYKGKYFGLEGSGGDNFRNVWQGSKPMNDTVPGSAFFSYETLGGGAHCCWNSMYDPKATNWTSVGVLGPNNGGSQVGQNAMGTYKAPSSIFQWMLRQGDTTLVAAGKPNQPPVAVAPAQTITLPVNSATLDCSGSYDPDGSIAACSWYLITGPTHPNWNGSTVSNLGEGVYVFQLSVRDNQGATSTATTTVTVNPALKVILFAIKLSDGKTFTLYTDGTYTLQ